MKDVIPRGPKIERIARFQSLQAGQYWCARVASPQESIEVGEVLLIQSIRWVQDAPHTIILRPHPRKIGVDTCIEKQYEDGTSSKRWVQLSEHRFLLEEFLAKFEFEPDSQRIRAQEVAGLQGEIAALQSELVATQTDPEKLAAIVEQGLNEAAAKQLEAAKNTEDEDEGAAVPAESVVSSTPGTALVSASASEQLRSLSQGSLSDALAGGITAEVIGSLKSAATRQHQIATIKAKWIEGKTGAIAATLRALSPFYEEQAAAALASTEDVRSYVDRLMQGIGSLDLYVGKNVVVQEIRTGKDAAEDIPLTLVQRKLLMDEELAVWAPVGERFDFGNDEEFFEALRNHPGLVRQIFPTERCVLVMATTRRHIDYGDPWANAARKEENGKVFLLVRNGENLYRVFSPVESHLGAARLFPSTNDLDQIFRGVDGRNIRVEDVAYTDHLSVQDALALHYKRFLLLACGLDHRLKLFGSFYPGPQNFDFVSIEFQAQYCRYLIDDEGSGNLLAQGRPTVEAWITTKNAYLRAGSRVLCQYRELMNPTTAPSVCKYRDGSRFDWRYSPTKPFEVTIARREGDSLVVEAPVSGRTQRDYTERSFNARVDLSKLKNSDWGYGDLPLLCLDAVSPEDVRYYIHHRESRREHLTYIRFFKEALAFLEVERETERPAREALRNSLEEGRIASGPAALDIIDQAVIAWRAAHNGKTLPAPAAANDPEWKSLLDQLYMLAGEGPKQAQEVEALLAAKDLIPLRLVLSGGAKLIVYAAPNTAGRDDRLEPHAWVHRIALHRGRRALTEKSRKWVLLPRSAASETTLHEWEAAAEWAKHKPSFGSYEAKQTAFAKASHLREDLAPWGTTMTQATWRPIFEAWREARQELLKRGRHVQNPGFAVPFGLMLSNRKESFSYLCVGTAVPHALLYRLAPDEAAREELRRSFVSAYANKQAAREQFEYAVAREQCWDLMALSSEFTASKHGNFYAYEWGVSQASLAGDPAPDPRLAVWFAQWQETKDSQRKVWLAPDALDSATVPALIADKLLNIELPDDFAPTQIFEVTLMPGEDAKATRFDRWFDLVPETIEKYSPRHGKGVGMSHRSSHAESVAAAERAMRASAKKLEPTWSLILASTIPEAPQPDAGVTRWYLMPHT